ncbi:MAG TPA: TIGR04282 family arsenosugar biosynthesis glycosyltransferase [Malonomonas sp.]
MEDVDNSNKKTPKTAILGIYAKQPLPGQVKTRLCPPLSTHAAAELYRCCLLETVQRMQAGGFDLVICYAGERQWFAETFPGISLSAQNGADLGARMANSLSGFLQQGYQQAVLIGSDAPDLPLQLVKQAFIELQQAEVVLAPADDGGYVLIGESAHRPELFKAIEWSTDAVLPETLKRIKACGIAASLLPGWDDLDDLDALKRFLLRSPQSATARYLQQHLAPHL